MVLSSGFSLLELLIAVAIILTLAAIATPSFIAARDSAKYTKAIGDIYTLEKDILTYKVTYNSLPHTLTQVGRGDLLDPWGAPYQYLNYADDGKPSRIRRDRFLHPLNSEYDLYSKGKDGQSNTSITARASRDDVIRANDGSYIGLAWQF